MSAGAAAAVRDFYATPVLVDKAVIVLAVLVPVEQRVAKCRASQVERRLLYLTGPVAQPIRLVVQVFEQK